MRYCVERAAWSIEHDGSATTAALRDLAPGLRCSVTSSALGWRHQVLHFGSLWATVAEAGHAHPSNRLAATVFHGADGLNEGFTRAFAGLRRLGPRLERVVVSCSIMRDRLTAWGVAPNRLVVVPVGVDVGAFSPASASQRDAIRQRLGVPSDAVCIGSFQKDGSGWGDGLQPKLIKGPDILVEVVAALACRRKLFVLLTGPARGYVKQRLQDLGVPFRHDLLPHPNALADHYRALDVYLVTSREEGGPKAVPEALASGVPLVTTEVGMAPDLIRHEENGMLAPVEDVAALAAAVERLIGDDDLRRRVMAAGPPTASQCDWRVVAESLAAQVYRPMLAQLDQQAVA